MFTEIKRIQQSIEFLNQKHRIKDNSNLKYNHMLDCLNILKYYNCFEYLTYGPAVLLHDIGRFYEGNNNNDNNFDHARFGYELLKKEFTNNPIILLPIKYHEDDLKWENLLLKDKMYINSSKRVKRKIVKGCKLVRDIDVISNMKYLADSNDLTNQVDFVNENILKKLINGQICTKEDIRNSYDEISYILCGLNLISFKRSFKYIKKENIIERLKKAQLRMAKNKKVYEYTIKMYREINNIINNR